MQAACGVGNDHVIAAGRGALDGVKNDGGRVGAHAGLHQRHLRPLGPKLKLLTGGSAEGIARCQHDAAALLFVQARQLGDRGRLAHTVDADDQNDSGLAVQLHRVAGGQLLTDDAAQGVQRLLPGLEVLFLDLIVQLVHKAHSAGGADIGQNELLLQPVIQVIIDLRVGQRIDDALEKAGAGLFQTTLDLLLLLKLLFRNIAFEKVEKAHSWPSLLLICRPVGAGHVRPAGLCGFPLAGGRIYVAGRACPAPTCHQVISSAFTLSRSRRKILETPSSCIVTP